MISVPRAIHDVVPDTRNAAEYLTELGYSVLFVGNDSSEREYWTINKIVCSGPSLLKAARQKMMSLGGEKAKDQMGGEARVPCNSCQFPITEDDMRIDGLRWDDNGYAYHVQCV